MNEIDIEPFQSQDGINLRTGERGWGGHFVIPGRKRSFNSTNDNIQITIHSGLSCAGRAQSLSHELYGHGYFYMITGGNIKMSFHSPCNGQIEGNTILYNHIEKSISETIKNMSR